MRGTRRTARPHAHSLTNLAASSQRLTYIMDAYNGMFYPRLGLPSERAMTAERLRDEPLGMPSPEALKMATDFMRRRYVLPETMQHPVVKSECLRLAYMIQAYGLAAPPSLGEDSVQHQKKGSTLAA